MKISVIICTRDRAKFQRAETLYHKVLAGQDHEMIRIDNPTGLCAGYNRGLDQSTGDVVLFSHDDIAHVADDIHAKVIGHLNHCDVFGVAGTTWLCGPAWITAGPPHIYGQIVHQTSRMISADIYGAPTRRVDGIQAVDGVLIGCRRQVAQTLRFDEVNFPGFHLYDLDFSFRAYKKGYRVAVCNDLNVVHVSEVKTGPSAAEKSKFMQLHDSIRPPIHPPQGFTWSQIAVGSVSEALERLRPVHWV